MHSRPNLTRNNKKKIFNDPIYGFISIPDEFIFDLIENPFFQRLRRIAQLGTTSLVYPGALHTRFHHVLGESGDPMELMTKYGIDTQNVVDAVLKVIKRK